MLRPRPVVGAITKTANLPLLDAGGSLLKPAAQPESCVHPPPPRIGKGGMDGASGSASPRTRTELYKLRLPRPKNGVSAPFGARSHRARLRLAGGAGEGSPPASDITAPIPVPFLNW
jgi:hypothetical protein